MGKGLKEVVEGLVGVHDGVHLAIRCLRKIRHGEKVGTSDDEAEPKQGKRASSSNDDKPTEAKKVRTSHDDKLKEAKIPRTSDDEKLKESKNASTCNEKF